ncbi:MAG: aminopeptidase P family protein [Elusimicrobia bacterium]|nr:aminopeptidase P family protein [Elusimicrobiota bacterium]
MNFYARRIKDLQGLLKDDKIDALVVTRPLETAFLTGFSMDGYIMLVSRTDAWAFMPKMLLEQFNSKAPFINAASCDNTLEAVISKVKEQKLKKTAFEPETETYLRGQFWAKQGCLEKKGLTASLRLIKEGEEVTALRHSCRIAAEAFKRIKPRVKRGRTEISVSRELEDLMQAMGAKGPSFNLIIGFGPDSALPHHESSERELKNNEAVLIDFGCIYKGYCSDITRTFFYGRPTPEFLKIHSIVAASQKAGVKAVKAGVKARLVDKVCRDHIADAGYGQYFIHGTGHGVGLEIHEAPTLNTKSEETLKAGMAVTVEPGIYLSGKFGVRIEDSVLVKKNGCEILTK